MGAKDSAAHFVMKAPDHILAEGTTWVPKVQQCILWWKHQITYFLRAEHGCKRFSSAFYDESTSTRSHTNWGQNVGAKDSAVHFVMKAPDHILPEGRTWVQKVQQHICDESTRSHTTWEHNMGAKGSAVDFVMQTPDHILAEGRTCKGSAVFWWRKDMITHFLRVEQGHKKVSRQFYSARARSYTFWRQNKAIRGSAGILWRCQITYILRTQHSHKRLSSRFAARGPHYIHSEGGTH